MFKLSLILQLLIPLWLTNAGFNIWSFIRKKYNLPDYSLDLNKKFFDQKRIFGDSKTMMGIPLSLILGCLSGLLIQKLNLGFILGISTYIGSTISGFFKRRIGLKRGASFPVLDQSDYLIAAYSILNILNINYFDNQTYIYAFFTTLIVHSLTNIITYKMGIRKYPW
ncbi:CDP-archaeol synthase [Candidatus Dojkabacteria bacterium]|nr:CDP-archaeol synthase [Candidatus Dojkabacteria bacterium]